VPAVFRRTVADPVLYDRHDAAGVESALAMLKAGDVRAYLIFGARSVFAERAGHARPSRLGREVGLGRQRHLNADGTVLLARHVTEAPCQRGVSDRGEAERFRPLREAVRLHRRADHVLEVIAWVGADRDGNTEAGVFGDALEQVVLGGDGGGVRRKTRDQIRHVGAVDQSTIGGCVVRGAHADAARGAGASYG